MDIISGFSKMSKVEKISWLLGQVSGLKEEDSSKLTQFWNESTETQKRFDEFSENTLTNYYLPFGLAPNFLIDDKIYAVPMVIEESSVVAAASLAAKFWLKHGGFKTKILGLSKLGHVHFLWKGDPDKLKVFFNSLKNDFVDQLHPLTSNMKQRGGGIESIELINRTEALDNYFQLEVKTRTCDAMGANFINSILEELAHLFKKKLEEDYYLGHSSSAYQHIMSILSNYTQDCLVEASVSSPVHELDFDAQKFVRAVEIATVSVERAVTHNKGIMNGVDAVVIATGNDFRSIEACAHAYAAREGQYKSLSKAWIENDIFHFSLTLPLNLGTTGGLTSLHPLANISLDILEKPTAPQLMSIAASVGLAQNFSAVKSLTTTGIQKGHMKLHLLNILSQFQATEIEKEIAKKFFSDKVVSYQAVREFLFSSRTQH